MNFQASIKFVIVSVRQILSKVGVDRFTDPRREINIKNENDFELLWKTLGSKERLLQPFLVDFPSKKETCYACVRLILQKVRADGFTGPRRETDVRY